MFLTLSAAGLRTQFCAYVSVTLGHEEENDITLRSLWCYIPCTDCFNGEVVPSPSTRLIRCFTGWTFYRKLEQSIRMLTARRLIICTAQYKTSVKEFSKNVFFYIKQRTVLCEWVRQILKDMFNHIPLTCYMWFLSFFAYEIFIGNQWFNNNDELKEHDTTGENRNLCKLLVQQLCDAMTNVRKWWERCRKILRIFVQSFIFLNLYWFLHCQMELTFWMW